MVKWLNRLKLKEIYFKFFIGIIILFGILLRLKGLLINPSMWHDECALAWNIKTKTYLGLFGHLRFLQMAPPLFLISTKFLVNLLHVQNTVGICDLVMRLIPFFCGCLSIGIFYLISRECFQSKKALILALFLFVVNKVLIDYSYEFKPYESDVMSILLLILVFIKLNLHRINFKKLLLYSFGLALGIWFSFVSIFFIAAGFLNLILKRENLKKIFIFILPIVISICFYLKFYILGIYHDTGKGMLDFWSNAFILPDFSNFLYLLTENVRYFFFPVKSILFIFILSFYGIFIYIKEKKYDFINVILFAFIFLTIASVLHLYPFSKRLVLFLIPIFILLLIKPFDLINFKEKTKSFLIIFFLFFIFVPQVQFVVNNLMKPINKGDFSREMMSYMVQNLKENDLIFVNTASRADYEFYSSFYKIKNKVIYDSFGNTPGEAYLRFLNNLQEGTYWIFMPYDYSPQKNIINYVKKWVLVNTRVMNIKEATQSVLMYVHLD